ncbi:DUF2934 domain-containing protein [Oleiagrimonas sp. C23AA]|uniref:DUF2934 domain-containing protein n=1 Tax=Oleiagrimonas sp. C23AA TaxID=2719047 RepID=UPI00141E7BB6|nr:DUF2934 domain-containing protein [Oleiagrimonas sp. C23AA]NII11136.1 DUF2934 domain-containing protein [Oleiagrimonas sp. C23AA]
MNTTVAPREARIRELAHHIWESEGCPDGQEARHWSMAERLVDAEDRVYAEQHAPAPPRRRKRR